MRGGSFAGKALGLKKKANLTMFFSFFRVVVGLSSSGIRRKWSAHKRSTEGELGTEHLCNQSAPSASGLRQREQVFPQQLLVLSLKPFFPSSRKPVSSLPPPQLTMKYNFHDPQARTDLFGSSTPPSETLTSPVLWSSHRLFRVAVIATMGPRFGP